MSKDEKTYEANLLEFEKNYRKNHAAMYEHIREQWLDSVFCKWQIFRNKPGFANTNSNLEGFNATVKRDFTDHTSFHISGAIRIIGDIIAHYSINFLIFENSPKFDKNVVDLASRLTKSNFTYVDRNNIVYKGVKNTFKLNLNNPSCFNKCCCNCETFMKQAVCMHLVGY